MAPEPWAVFACSVNALKPWWEKTFVLVQQNNCTNTAVQYFRFTISLTVLGAPGVR